MVPYAPRDAASAGRQRIVTVADLLRRSDVVPAPRPVPAVPAQRTPAEDEPGYISVGALLRREGRAPHAADRPVRPRGRAGEQAHPPTGAEPAARRGGVVVRRASVAAGALLTAGSVFGAAVLTDASGTDVEGSAGVPGRDGGGATGPGVALAPAGTGGTGSAPDPGLAAPLAWMEVAFPATIARTTGAAAPTTAPTTAPGSAPASPAPAPPSTTTAPGTSPAGPADGPGGTTSEPAAPGPVGGAVEPVAETVDDVGDAAPPLRPVTEPVGGAVSGLGSTVEDTTRPVTGSLTGGLLG